jgi:hypothetical protein
VERGQARRRQHRGLAHFRNQPFEHRQRVRDHGDPRVGAAGEPHEVVAEEKAAVRSAALHEALVRQSREQPPRRRQRQPCRAGELRRARPGRLSGKGAQQRDSTTEGLIPGERRRECHRR